MSSVRHNVVDKGTVLTPRFALLEGPRPRQLREERRTMAERGTSGERGDNRLGCHASVTMLWLKELAQGKQGGNQVDVFPVFFCLFATCLPSDGTDCLSFTDVKSPAGL